MVTKSTVYIIFAAHEEEVCGLVWSVDGSQLASGSNDNTCCIWDRQTPNAPRFRLTQHTAAVKALAWCPFQRNLLATGGGTADRHIRFFNSTTGAMVNAIDTHSQVCSLLWSRNSKVGCVFFACERMCFFGEESHSIPLCKLSHRNC